MALNCAGACARSICTRRSFLLFRSCLWYRNNDQDRRGQNDGYGDYGGSYELRQTALNAGYNEGVREGSNDRQNGRRFDYRDSNAYQKATQDYDSRLGDREVYRRYFREAFENGYDGNGNGQINVGRDDRYSNRDRNDRGNRSRRGRNWDGYGNYGGSPQLRQTAWGTTRASSKATRTVISATAMASSARVPTRRRRKTTTRVWATARCTSIISVRRTRTGSATASTVSRA